MFKQILKFILKYSTLFLHEESPFQFVQLLVWVKKQLKKYQ